MGVKGDDCATHRVEINLIDPNDVNLTTNGVTQPNELIYLGTLRNGKMLILLLRRTIFNGRDKTRNTRLLCTAEPA